MLGLLRGLRGQTKGTWVVKLFQALLLPACSLPRWGYLMVNVLLQVFICFWLRSQFGLSCFYRCSVPLGLLIRLWGLPLSKSIEVYVLLGVLGTWVVLRSGYASRSCLGYRVLPESFQLLRWAESVSFQSFYLFTLTRKSCSGLGVWGSLLLSLLELPDRFSVFRVRQILWWLSNLDWDRMLLTSVSLRVKFLWSDV